MREKFENLPLRSGVGIVVLNKADKVFVAKRIDNAKNFWQMPQGGVDEGEDFLTAAHRELEEETGINEFQLVNGFKEKIYYNIHKGSKVIPKEVSFFLAKSLTKNVKLSSEHQNYKWLNFRSALDQLTYSNAKEVLVKAKNFLDD